jgi:putative hydrolase of the HAD superfamily
MIKAVIFDMYETLITHYHTPLYFCAQMAAEAGIAEDAFRTPWKQTERERTTGAMSLEDALEMIFKKNQCYSEELKNRVVEKRIEVKEDCFRHLHPQIISMLEALKKKEILIGLISNCFSEEAKVIRQSVLFPYFDAFCLSYEQGCQKPEPEIFEKCLSMLKLKPEECLYVGDGGSHELEAASKIGMKAVQAAWYLMEGTLQPVGRKEEFSPMDDPMDVLRYV